MVATTMQQMDGAAPLLTAQAAAQAASRTAAAHRAMTGAGPRTLPASFRQLAEAIVAGRHAISSTPPLPWRFSLPYAALA